MSDIVTILGNIATDPVRSTTNSGIAVTNFRVASSQRRFDPRTQTWIDMGTNWYSVAAFRLLADHAKSSLHSGDSVIVTGRLKIREWEANGRKGTSVDLEAEAIGHDLRWGTSAFARANRGAQHAPMATGLHPAPRDADDSASDHEEESEFSARWDLPEQGADNASDPASDEERHPLPTAVDG